MALLAFKTSLSKVAETMNEADFFHATEYLTKVADAAHPEKTGKSERQRWLKERCHQLKHEPNAAEEILEEEVAPWVGYFGIQEFKYLFRDLDGWIRCRLRSVQLKKWKKPRQFQKVMIAAGMDPGEALCTWVFLPNLMGSVIDRGAVYLAGTYRSVGRG